MDARFGVDSFFLLLGSLAFCSLCAFFAISYFCQNFFVEDSISSATNYSDVSESNRDETIETPEPKFENSDHEELQPVGDRPVERFTQPSTRPLYVMLFVLCFFSNGFMPSISTYVAMPYGPEGTKIRNDNSLKLSLAYHTSTILSTVANPVACLLVAVFESCSLRSKRSFSISFLLTLVSTVRNWPVWWSF